MLSSVSVDPVNHLSTVIAPRARLLLLIVNYVHSRTLNGIFTWLLLGNGIGGWLPLYSAYNINLPFLFFIIFVYFKVLISGINRKNIVLHIMSGNLNRNRNYITSYRLPVICFTLSSIQCRCRNSALYLPRIMEPDDWGLFNVLQFLWVHWLLL